jgi:hypothetical protein
MGGGFLKFLVFLFLVGAFVVGILELMPYIAARVLRHFRSKRMQRNAHREVHRDRWEQGTYFLDGEV